MTPAGIVVDMAEQIVLMAGARAAPLQFDAFARLDENGVARLLVAPEEGCHRNTQRPRKGLQRRQRRRDVAVLDFRQHAQRNAGGGGKIGHGDAELLAEGADFMADGDFEIVFLRLAQRMRILRESSLQRRPLVIRRPANIDFCCFFAMIAPSCYAASWQSPILRVKFSQPRRNSTPAASCADCRPCRGASPNAVSIAAGKMAGAGKAGGKGDLRDGKRALLQQAPRMVEPQLAIFVEEGRLHVA